MPSKIIINSLKESILIIKKRKKTFLLIFILQIIFFLIIAALSSFYMANILQSTKNILEYTESLNLDPQTANIDILQQKSPLGPDPLLISRNYNIILKNLFYLLFFIFSIFILINGLIWYFSSNIENKNLYSTKIILSYLLKFFIASIILALFLYLMLYNLLKIAFSTFLSTQPRNLIPFLIITIMAIYFIYIAIPILNKIRIKSMLKKIFFIGTRNFIAIFISYLIIITLTILSFLLIFYSIEFNLIILLISILLLIFIFVFTKIYFSTVVKKLSGL